MKFSTLNKQTKEYVVERKISYSTYIVFFVLIIIIFSSIYTEFSYLTKKDILFFLGFTLLLFLFYLGEKIYISKNKILAVFNYDGILYKNRTILWKDLGCFWTRNEARKRIGVYTELYLILKENREEIVIEFYKTSLNQNKIRSLINFFSSNPNINDLGHDEVKIFSSLN